MPISDDDYEKLLAHMKATGGMNASCPVCKQAAWMVDGPVSLPYVREAWQLAPQEAVPAMLLICKTCFFVRQFAWRPIRDAAK